MDSILIEVGGLLLILFVGGVLASRLRLSVIPAYILVGVLVQPFVYHSELIQFMSTMGLVLLLFFIGLEFSLDRVARAWRPVAFAGTVDLLVNFPLGVAFGWLAGWGLLESLVLGGIVYVSSSAIVAKTLSDTHQAVNPEAETILGILVYEDMAVAVLIAVFSALAAAGVFTFHTVGWALLKVAVLAVGFVLLSRRYGKWVDRLLTVESAELFLLAVLAVVVLLAAMASYLGLSAGVGAFAAGLLIAETAHRDRVAERLIPFRDLFAAVFFLAFGLTVPVAGLPGVMGLLLILVVLTALGKLASGWLIGRLQGLSHPAALNIGVSTLARGEFSIVLAGIALAWPGTGHVLGLITGGYVLITGIAGAVLMKAYHHWRLQRAGRVVSKE